MRRCLDGPSVTAHAFAVDPALERCPFMPTYAPPQVLFVRGRGTELWDDTGKRYLDFLCGLGVTSLGHAHPEVTAAVTEQAEVLLHVSNLFASRPAAGVAVTLDRLLGGGGQVFFTNSGAEANECAIKLARRWGGGEHGRWQVISAYGSFHGRTMAALAATGQPTKHEPFQPLPPGFRHVAWGDVDAAAAAVDDTVAAVLIEAVQGEGGVVAAPPGYLRGLRELCDDLSLLLIVDEVQTGLGRTGRWFGYQHDLPEGVRPDIVTLAKALGNGVPVGACWARAEVAAAFRPGDHGTTYGGQPFAAAAAAAVLKVVERDRLPERANAVGTRLLCRLAAVRGIAAVRGRGLLLAAELEEGRDSRIVQAQLLRRGLVVNAVTPTALRLAPPLIVSDEEIDEAVALITEVLA